MNTWAKSIRYPFMMPDDGGQGGGGQGGTGEQGGQAGGNQGGNQGGTGGQAGGDGGNGQQDDQPPEMSDALKAYMEKIAQSSADKVRRQYADNVKDLERRLKMTEQEKETLAKEKMSDEEKSRYELDKRERALRDRESAILQKDIEIEATNQTAALQLPAKFKSFIMADSVENTAARAKDFQTAWNEAIQAEVEKRLAGSSRRPSRGNNSGQGAGETSGGMNALIRQGFGRG